MTSAVKILSHTTVPMLSSACTLNPRYPVGVARVPLIPPTAAHLA